MCEVEFSGFSALSAFLQSVGSASTYNVKSRANDLAPVPYDGREWCETDFSIPSEVKVGKQIGNVGGVKYHRV